MGWLAGIDFKLPIIVLVGMGLILTGISLPAAFLAVALLVTHSCLSFINEDWFRFAYVFRISDLFFLGAMFICFVTILTIKEEDKPKILKRYTIIMAIIVLATLLQIFITQMRFPETTLLSSLRMGRRYLYIMLFYPACIFLFKNKNMRVFVNIAAIFSTFVSIAFIIQFLSKGRIYLIPFSRSVFQNMLGISAYRIYISGTELINFTFFFIFFHYIFTLFNKQKAKILLILAMIFTALHPLLSLGRSRIIGFLLALFVTIFMARNKKIRLRIARYLLLSLGFFILVILLFGIISPGEKGLPGFIKDRTLSSFDEVLTNTGTFRFRLDDSYYRIQLIKDNPLLGIGFLHDESQELSYMRGFNGQFRTADSGLISLMIDFGLIGLIGFLVIFIFIFKDLLFLIRSMPKDTYEYAVIMSIFAVLLIYIVEFLTSGSFMSFGGFAVLGIFMGIVNNAIYRYQKSNVSSNQWHK